METLSTISEIIEGLIYAIFAAVIIGILYVGITEIKNN